MTTCAGFIEPLNLECLFLNIFAGSTVIFMGVAMLVFAALAARFQMRDDVVMVIMILFALILTPYAQGLFILVILIIWIVVYSLLKRPFSRT